MLVSKLKYFILDVFANTPYSGNPLGVFFDFGVLSSQEMQKIARELNFSETTFITSSQRVDGGYPVRIFTPTHEIPFAGHPTLGTAYILHRYLESISTEDVLLNLSIGQIPVSFLDNEYWMMQQQPVFGNYFSPEILANVLGISSNAIMTDWPIVEVSTGLPFLLVPLTSLEWVRKVYIQKDVYERFARSTMARGIAVFCQEGYEAHQQVAMRVFVPELGIPEDPATGSAAGCLAAYLLKFHPQQHSKLMITLGQGYEIDRTSEIKIQAIFDGQSYQIRVGGKVQEIAQGEWNIFR
ncbi:MAG TPA: PhzF family phenazine biosynthesis protein [Bacteroidales bacterium]|nr:PhzF family phenazine biosynthesis protein [Bacteroidales bacterium]HOK98731.1 PhzF family phenazine biosynthesis protein [Bacteroidales bacterium]HPO65629.1 PhzF family phenazine biosynthesis protein [Bacteroidales bacterium]